MWACGTLARLHGARALWVIAVCFSVVAHCRKTVDLWSSLKCERNPFLKLSVLHPILTAHALSTGWLGWSGVTGTAGTNGHRVM